jgi:hypothetical protein
MPANVAPQVIRVTVGEVPNVSIDCEGLLNSSELIATLTSILEVTTTDLTIDNKAISSTALTINGVSVITGQALTCRVAGVLAGVKYHIQCKFITNSTPAATRIADIYLIGVAA